MKLLELSRLIETKKFATSLYGYKAVEVNDFLEEIAVMVYDNLLEHDILTENLEKEKNSNKKLKLELEKLNFDLEKLRNIIEKHKFDKREKNNE